MEDRARIIEIAEKIYAVSGFYRTTMDDIAKELRVSKKTLYKHFQSKDELLHCVVDQIMETLSNDIEKVIGGEYNTVERLYLLTKTITKRMTKISEKWLDDLRIYKPELWEEIEKFKIKTGTKNILRIIDQGKAEELIVAEPTEVIATVMLASVQAVVNPEFILKNDISRKNASQTAMKMVFYGILTKKGRRLFKEFLEK